MSSATANSSSPSTNSSSTPTTTTYQTNKQITIQDIDTNKYEEILAKEPDLTRQPEKSALKKANGVKRRVIPVFRENQRPSPRPSPKLKPVVTLTSPITTTPMNDEHNSDSEHNENEYSSSDDDNDETKKRFVNVKRNDSLARFLKDRPLPNELYEKHILVKPVDERRNERETIETKLERKLSLRPTPEELEARNILRAKTQAELIAEKEEKKRYLIRKLSFRPSIQGKQIRFYEMKPSELTTDIDFYKTR
jgi:phosphatase and actin regulator 3